MTTPVRLLTVPGMAKPGPVSNELSDEAEPTAEDQGPPEFDGRPLKVLLEVVGIKQAELSRRTGVNVKTVSRIANGRIPLDRDTATTFARVLGLPPLAFAEARDFLAHADRLRGMGGVWSGGQWHGTPGSHVVGEEVMDDPTELKRWQKYLEDDRLAEASGRMVREFVLRILSRTGGTSYEDL